MMTVKHINILDPSVANKIAAGEVVERAQDCHQKRNKRVTTDGGPSGSMIPVP